MKDTRMDFNGMTPVLKVHMLKFGSLLCCIEARVPRIELLWGVLQYVDTSTLSEIIISDIVDSLANPLNTLGCLPSRPAGFYMLIFYPKDSLSSSGNRGKEGDLKYFKKGNQS